MQLGFVPDSPFGISLLSAVKKRQTDWDIYTLPTSELRLTIEQDFSVRVADIAVSQAKCLWWPPYSSHFPGIRESGEGALRESEAAARQWDSLASFFNFPTFQKVYPHSPRRGAELSNRLLSASILKTHGLPVPKSIVTTSKPDAERFVAHSEANGRRSVLKLIHDKKSFHDGSRFYSTFLTLDHMADLSEYMQPIWIEEFVEREREFRLYVLKDASFGFVLHNHSKDVVDIRSVEQDIVFEPLSNVPLAGDLLTFCNKEAIDFCCFDILADQYGKHWVVDVNPFGTTDGLPDMYSKRLVNSLAEHITSL